MRCGAATTLPTAPPRPTAGTSSSASSSSCCCWRRRGAPPALIMPVVSLLFIAYAMLGPHLPAPWTHRGYDVARLVGHLFITLEGIFGVAVDVSATLIILFTIYGAFLQQSGAGKFFIDFSLALMGGKAEQRRPHRGAVVVPARRSLRIGRRHDRHDRHRGLSDDGQGRLREKRRRRLARGRRAGRDPVAAGAGRRRVPDRRVSQDQLSRRDLDGDHPDLSLLHVAAVHGRTRRQEVRRQGRHLHAGDVARPDDQALRLPLHLAARRRRVHDDRLFAVAVGVLCHRRHLRAELPAQGNRAGADASW